MGWGSPANLARLLDGPQPCPVCDGYDCEHRFYGEEHWRIGDPMAKKHEQEGRTIPCPHRLIDPDTGRVVGKGHMLTPEQAARLGVLPAAAGTPEQAARLGVLPAAAGTPGEPRAKGKGRRPNLDRARHLSESRPKRTEDRT